MYLLEELSNVGHDFDRALELVMEHFGAQTGTIHTLEVDGMLHMQAHRGHIPPQVLEVTRTIPVGKGLAGLAVLRKEPVNLCNLQTDDSGQAKPGAKSTGVQGAVCIPMMAGDHAAGALGIATMDERTFTDEEVELLLEAGQIIIRSAGMGIGPKE